MQERINRLYSWIGAQESCELRDVGKQLLSIIEEQEKRICLLEGNENTVNMCIECGKYPADAPSKFCCGCNEYRNHNC